MRHSRRRGKHNRRIEAMNVRDSVRSEVAWYVKKVGHQITSSQVREFVESKKGCVGFWYARRDDTIATWLVTIQRGY